MGCVSYAFELLITFYVWCQNCSSLITSLYIMCYGSFMFDIGLVWDGLLDINYKIRRFNAMNAFKGTSKSWDTIVYLFWKRLSIERKRKKKSTKRTYLLLQTHQQILVNKMTDCCSVQKMAYVDSLLNNWLFSTHLLGVCYLKLVGETQMRRFWSH